MNSLTALKGKLLPEEQKIIELKYSGKTFGVMTTEERWFSAQTLLLKIHAITGWSVPVSEMMDILIDQFQQKLIEKYRNVTIKEIEYAFRNKGTDIKDWGKAMNLSLFDEVMIPYLEERFDLSRTEESLKKPIMIENKEPLTDEDYAEWLMDWKIMSEINIDLIPLPFYDFITNKNLVFLTNKQKWEYTERATTNIKFRLQEEMGVCKTNDAYIAFNKFCNQEKTGFEKEFKGRILNRAKRLIVYDYLKDKLNQDETLAEEHNTNP